MLLIQSTFVLSIDQSFWCGLLQVLLDTLESPTHAAGVHSTSKKSLGSSCRESLRPQSSSKASFGWGELVYPSEYLRGKWERTPGLSGWSWCAGVSPNHLKTAARLWVSIVCTWGRGFGGISLQGQQKIRTPQELSQLEWQDIISLFLKIFWLE